jgi:hypothetical protein
VSAFLLAAAIFLPLPINETALSTRSDEFSGCDFWESFTRMVPVLETTMIKKEWDRVNVGDVVIDAIIG